MEKTKQLTWLELKKVINEMPESLLGTPVILWPTDNDESGIIISEVDVLDEDYLYDGDEGCAPESVMKETSDSWGKEEEEEHYIIHAKGTPILYAQINKS